MATRSTIALEYADGTVGQVYCHWDGYLENNGMLLYKNYSNAFILRDLLDMGDISSLGKIVGTKHPFSPFEGDKAAHEAAVAAGATTFYGRDRGETGVDQRMFKSFEDYVENHQYEEYEYILRKDGNWYVKCHSADYVLLADALAEDLREKAEAEEEALDA
jgi:hypothetical protein